MIANVISIQVIEARMARKIREQPVKEIKRKDLKQYLRACKKIEARAKLLKLATKYEIVDIVSSVG